MRAIHRLLALYTAILAIFILLFASAVFYTSTTKSDILNMAISVILFSLIPFGIIYLIWKHHKHHR